MSRPCNNPPPSYAFGAHPRQEQELERLRRQALIAWPQEKAWLQRLGLRDGMRVLDAGCGPGVVTAKIAEINPRGETVGLEPDPGLAAIADAAFKGHRGLSLQVGSLAENALPDAHFDFAYVRFVLQHVPRPVDNVRALMRVLRPGGIIVLADADDGLTIFHPEPPGLTIVMRALEARQARAGGDRRVGRKLPEILADAGFGQVGFHVLPFTSDGLGRGPFLDLVLTSRLLRIGAGEEPGVEAAAATMLDDLARCEWRGIACVVVAHASRPRA